MAKASESCWHDLCFSSLLVTWLPGQWSQHEPVLFLVFYNRHKVYGMYSLRP